MFCTLRVALLLTTLGEDVVDAGASGLGGTEMERTELAVLGPLLTGREAGTQTPS